MTRLEYSILQSHFPEQTNIILDSGTSSGLPCNSVGKIMHINREMNTIFAEFENGQRFSLIYGVDIFHKYTKPFFTPRGDL